MEELEIIDIGKASKVHNAVESVVLNVLECKISLVIQFSF